jgi:hypothetical protein
MPSDNSTLSFIRKALLAILVLGVVGTQAELLLLKHTDGVWQLVPIYLNWLALVVLAWYGLRRSAASLRAIQWVMLLCLLSGGVGAIQHFRGNVGYAEESNPGLSGRDLYIEAVQGSTPTLAPGTMVQLALIGLAFTFRHPGLRRKHQEEAIT